MGGRVKRVIATEPDVTLLAVAGAVGLNILAGLTHGTVHVEVPVHLTGWQRVLIATSVFIGPVAGVWLVSTGKQRMGGAVVAVSMAVAFGFELLAHFVVRNPDYVGSVVRLTSLFTVTAQLTVATDLLALAVGVWCWSRAKSSHAPARIDPD